MGKYEASKLQLKEMLESFPQSIMDVKSIDEINHLDSKLIIMMGRIIAIHESLEEHRTEVSN